MVSFLLCDLNSLILALNNFMLIFMWVEISLICCIHQNGLGLAHHSPFTLEYLVRSLRLLGVGLTPSEVQM